MSFIHSKSGGGNGIPKNVTYGKFVGWYNSSSSLENITVPVCGANHISVHGSCTRANFVMWVKDESGTEIDTLNGVLSTQRVDKDSVDVSGNDFITIGWKSGTAGVNFDLMITIIDERRILWEL